MNYFGFKIDLTCLEGTKKKNMWIWMIEETP